MSRGLNGRRTESTGTIAAAVHKGHPEQLRDAFRTLNDQRIDIDRRITVLAPDDPDRDILWQDLEPVLVQLREVVDQLAKSPAIHLPDLQAKAEVLAKLIQPGDADGDPVISESERSALALSLADDIGHLPGG